MNITIIIIIKLIPIQTACFLNSSKFESYDAENSATKPMPHSIIAHISIHHSIFLNFFIIIQSLFFIFLYFTFVLFSGSLFCFCSFLFCFCSSFSLLLVSLLFFFLFFCDLTFFFVFSCFLLS